MLQAFKFQCLVFILVCFILFFFPIFLFLQVFFLISFFFFLFFPPSLPFFLLSFLSPLLLCHTHLIKFHLFVLLLLVPSFTLHPTIACSFLYILPCCYLFLRNSPCYLPSPYFMLYFIATYSFLHITPYCLFILSYLILLFQSPFKVLLPFPPLCCYTTYSFVLVGTSPPLSFLQDKELGTSLE